MCLQSLTSRYNLSSEHLRNKQETYFDSNTTIILLLIMEDCPRSLPPCKCCSLFDTSADKQEQEQPCCNSIFTMSSGAIRTIIDQFALGTCIDLAAQQECDAYCHDGETLEASKGRRISPLRTLHRPLTDGM